MGDDARSFDWQWLGRIKDGYLVADDDEEENEMDEKKGIADELRRIAGHDLVGCRSADEAAEAIYALADRIDREMVELPKDADGREVPLDTKELYDANGRKVNISSFAFRCDAHGCWSDWKAFSPDARREDGMFYVDGLYLTPPADSWERIADELDEMVEAAQHADDTCEKLADIAERIRKLAEREG